MTKFYSRQDDFKKKDFVHPQIDLVCRMLGQIDDAGAAVQAEGLGYLYYSRGEAVLGAGKSSASFLESTSRVAQLLMSASDVHAEVLQSIDSKLVKGLDEAFSSLNAVNSKAKPYKTAGKTYQTETYSYDMVNGYTIKKTTVTKHYTLDEILDRKNSPIPAVRDTYAQKAKAIRERLGKADDLAAEEIEKVKKMSDEELLDTYLPRLLSKDSYQQIKTSTFHELNKGSLSGIEDGADFLAGFAMVAGVALAPFTGGTSLYLTYTGGVYIAGSRAYSAVTGNTLISGTQLSTTGRVFAGIEAVTTVLTLGGISVAKEGLSVSAKTAKVLTTLGNVADKVDDTMDVVQLAHGISEGNMESALADFALGKGMSIGVGGGINLVGNHLKKVRMKPEFDMDGGGAPSPDYKAYVEGKLAEGKVPLTEFEWRQKVGNLQSNQTTYEAFKNLQLEEFKGKALDVQERITIEITTDTGEVKRVQVNAIGVDADGRIRIQEYTTAKDGLSINRQQLLEDLSKYGGTVVGKGKGEFTGGIEVPKGTQIEVISQKTGVEVLRFASVANESTVIDIVSKYDDIYAYEFNSTTNPGPLAELSSRPNRNFYGGRYNIRELDDDIVLYRAGRGDNPMGQWFTTEPPFSRAQVRIDTAVKDIWTTPEGVFTGQSPIDKVYKIKIPRGTTIYDGPVGSQGGIYQGGLDKIQIFIDSPWNIEGVEALDSWYINP